MSFYPPNLQWIGAAKETVPNTPEALPTMWWPVKSPKYAPTIAKLDDDAIRGGMAKTFAVVDGMRYDKLDFTTYPYLDSIYQLLVALLGGTDTVTGSSDPYTHEVSLYNGSGSDAAAPPTYTLFYDDGTGTVWQIAGCVLADLKFTVQADQITKVECQWMGLPATIMGTPPTNTPTANKPWPGWNSTLTLAGTADLTRSSVTLDYKRKVEAPKVITGTQSPGQMYAGEVDATFDFVGAYQGGAAGDLADFIAGTQPTFSIKMAPPGDTVHSLTLTHSLLDYKTSDPEGGSTYMEIKSKGEAIANPTDGSGGDSPVKVTFATSTQTPY